MKKTALVITVASFLVGLTSSLEAQKVYRISALVADDQFVPAFDGFKKKMADVGYKEGKNVNYDFHNAKGDDDALIRLANQLVQDRPDLIVTTSSTSTAPVARATAGTTIPVVFLSAGEPLKFVKSYASSGNNLTGISTAVLDLTEKRLELLKELAPWVKRLASLSNPHGVTYQDNLIAVREGGKRLRLSILEKNATTREELEKVTATITRKVTDAIVIQPDSILGKNMDIIREQSIRERLPLIPPPAFIKSGGLATYGPDNSALGKQGAILVDKIIKGARPADLPIEQPSKMNLVINLKTAKAIGLKIPKDILLRADEVFE